MGLKLKKIQKIKTFDGHMIPIFRDWDHSVNEGHLPKMVYATTLERKVKKDIILHEKRTSYLTCIQGSVKIEFMEDNEIKEAILDATIYNDSIDLALISPNIPIQLENLTDETAIIINCPSPSWHPDDQDTIKFKSWSDFKQWKSKD